jgi:hypothetical protein
VAVRDSGGGAGLTAGGGGEGGSGGTGGGPGLPCCAATTPAQDPANDDRFYSHDVQHPRLRCAGWVTAEEASQWTAA